MAVTHTRVVATIGTLAALTFAVPAFGGQAERRATNKDQKAQTNQPQRQTASRDEGRQAPPAGRPQEQSSSRPALNPAGNASNARPTQGYAVPRPREDAHPPKDIDRNDRNDRNGWNDRNDRNDRDRWDRDDRRTVIIAPRPYYRPYRVTRFHEPFFTFRPRFQLSIGISIGHPVAYPVWYDPYPVYGRSLGPRYGGLSFDMDPWDASVFIDGNYVGIVDDFSPYDAPLTLRAGVHRVELRARGCQPMVFDITVVPGQVIPYRGSLAYGR